MHFSLSTSALRAEDRRVWTAIGLVAAVLFAVWLAWLLLARVPLYVASEAARVEVRRAGHAVDAPDTARVVRIHAALGQRVDAGQLLLQLDDTVERLQRDELAARAALQKAAIEALARQAASLESGLRNDAATTTAKRREAEELLRVAESAARLAEEEVSRAESLFRAQLISASALASARATAAQRRAAAQAAAVAVGRASTEGKSFDAERRAALENLRSERSQLEGERNETEVAMRRLGEIITRRAIVAPVAGTIGDLLPLTPGMTVQAGARIAVVVPGGGTHIVAEFPPRVAAGRVGVGQRARFRLQPFAWHVEEDRQVREHLHNSIHMDRAEAALLAMPPLWTVVGIVALIPSFFGGGIATADLVASIGGIVLATLSLGKLITAAPALADAAIVWRQIASTFRAAERPLLEGVPGASSRRGDVVMTASDVAFAYPSRGLRPVLSGCTLTIRDGDRILVDAPSGAGKSTLLSLLTGLRRPTSGVLLLDGLDLHTLGETEWRRRAAAAPQFHDNHVFADTLAFNLLMGRQWPPDERDLAEAEEVCRELGMGELLDRMPSGLLQMIGDAGWQLSHGEKSRLFVARALLQDARVVALDESFAALDPVNFERCVRVVTARARTLLLVAHT
jgi:ABC-type multidrug transport system fused ATPase/permease subunit